MLASETVQNRLMWGREGGGENNFAVDPPNQSCIFSYLINIPKSTPNPYCGQESTFYIPSILIPLSTPTLEGWQCCHTLKRNNSAFKPVHCRCLTPHSLVSQPRALVGVKHAYFRDDILLPSSWRKKVKEKIDKLCSFSVCEKQAVPHFVLSKTSFFPTAIAHF